MNKKEKIEFSKVVKEYGHTNRELGRMEAQFSNLERQGLGYVIALAIGILIGILVR